MLFAEAVAAVHPDIDAPVFANLPISVRRMLGCEETFKNCSSRIVLPLSGTPLDALPFAERAAQLRGVLKMQMNPDMWRSVYNMLNSRYVNQMEEPIDYWEKTKRPSGFATVGHDTFYIDYIGRLRKTEYSDNLTDVRFICKPPAGSTLHINVIDHGGQFRIDCLACDDIRPLIDALEQGTIGAAALDTIENELNLYYLDKTRDVLPNRDRATLMSFPNVVVSPHMAFYTQEAVEGMIQSNVDALLDFEAGRASRYEIPR